MADLSARSSGDQLPVKHRLRSLGWFLLAGVFAVFSQQFATHAAMVLVPGPFYALASRCIFLALLLLGFAVMGVLGQRQRAPLAAMGLVRRSGAVREWAMGAMLGWSGIVVCVLPVALTGGLLVTVGNHDVGAAGAIVVDLLTLLLAALADEVLFRGYPFQRLIEVTGPALATILMMLIFAVGRGVGYGSSAGSVLVALLLGLLLATAYLRTRALWVGWGFHFAWNASMAILFGLPVGGLTTFSPVVSSYTSGPAWLTGGGFGPEGSATAVVVLVIWLILLARATRELRHRWAHPEIIGAGIPVDLDAASKRMHEEAMGPAIAPAGAQLVQIAPVAPPPPLPAREQTPED